MQNKNIYEGQSKYVNILYIIFSERTILKEVSRKNLLTEAAQIRGNLLKHKHLRKWKNTKIKARSEKQIVSVREQNIQYDNKKGIVMGKGENINTSSTHTNNNCF